MCFSERQVKLTNHASHDGADTVGQPEQMRDGGGIEQAVGHLALRRHHRRVGPAERHRRQPALVYSFQRIFCNDGNRS